MATVTLSDTDPGRDTPAGVLGALRASRETARRAEVESMVAALDWADLHSVDSLDHAATVPGTDRGLALAGECAPLVAEFAVVELAAALGRSADSARLWLGATLEIRYRLPRTWARLMATGLEPWRARQVASHTMLLCREAASWVDAQVAPIAHKIGPAQLERIVAEAVRRYDPEQAYENELATAERRHVTIHDQHLVDGCVEVTATIDAIDAHDLNTAVGKTAHDLLLAGSTESLDVRRAQALGEIARHELTLDLSEHTPEPGTGPGSTLYVHFDAEALDLLEDETGTDQPVALIERLGGARDVTVGIDRLRAWLTRPNTSVTIRPVIDLNTTITSSGHQPSARLREQIVLRNRVCVFPHCTRTARSADLDHIEPHEHGGPTSSENLAPLCRLHHRVKTHSAWSYTPLAPGEFLWHSPHGDAYLVDPTGTTPQPPQSDQPLDPPPRHPRRP
jgi:hypothetical protein